MCPCYKCEERERHCHSKCPKDDRGEFGYIAWKATLPKPKEPILPSPAKERALRRARTRRVWR